MNWWRKLQLRLRVLFQKRKLDDEMDEEMRSHIEMQTQENIEAGMNPEEARYAALRQFGWIESIKETCRDQRGLSWIENLGQDVRYGARMLRKNPGFTAVAVLTLALGMGANTAIYSVVNTVLLTPVPGPEPNRLMQIGECAYDTHNKAVFYGVSPPVLEALMANQDFFSDFVWSDGVGLYRKAEDFSDYVAGEMVSPNFFALWNIRPILGRTFAKDVATPVDENGNPTADSVVVLSYASWQKLFAGDEGVIGKTIELSGRHFTVVGVMPPHFRFPREVDPLVWVPSEPRRLSAGVLTGPNTQVLVRLKPGITDEQAQAMLDTVAQRLMKDHASDNGYGQEWRQRPQGLGFWIRPLRYHFQGGYGSEDLRGTLFGLLGAIGFVLLIACVNVANLTLARTERRQQELAIRAALGAARVRLMRQLLTENVLLGCLGGLAGVGVTYWGMKMLVVLIPPGMPRLKPVQIDGHALGFTLLVSVITGLVFGLAPAWHAGRSRLNNALKQAGTGATAGVSRSKYRGALVIIEVALSLVLLTGAGLMIQSVVRLLHVNPGYDPENLLFIRVYLPGKYADYSGDPNQKQARGLLRNVFFSDAHRRLAALPGVKAAGILKDALWGDKFVIDGRSNPVELYSAGCGVEESDCFRAMRVPLLAGRYFEKSDIGEKAGTVILNESAARLCWPGEKAVGKKLRKPERAGDKVYEVVGVVADARLYKYDQSIQPIFFRPYHEFDIIGLAAWFVVRTQQDPHDLFRAIHKELKAVEPAMLTPEIKVVQQVLYDSTVAQRTYMIYLVVFAGVGLFLAALGIYGVLAYSVARRTREIGIRLALGADRRDVLGMVIREGARLVMVGVAVGLLAAFWLTRLLRNQLFGVSPTDPVVLAVVVLVVLAVALLACLLPARRATRVDPMEALRYE